MPPGEGLHETVARTARSRPDAVALVTSHRTMTYGELDRAADAWAARLAAAGLGRGRHAPIVLPRGPELVTALLAVLKTGAAYALLDPAWPARRLAEAIEDLDAPLLIAERGTADLPALPLWTPPAGPIAPEPDFRAAAAAGSDPSCVFFTSGTTGRPKAVLVPHRATARLFQPDTFARFNADTVMPLAAPAPWDAFSLELWSVLLTGGTSVIVDEPYLSAQSLRSAVSLHAANTAWLTASLFNMIVDEDPDAFRGLRQLMIGGERLSTAHVGRFLRRHPGITLLNGYGPVESTVFATTHRITPTDCERADGIPLGRPVPGTRVHVMNGSRVCAVDEAGEICISGDGLALRYLGSPALTEAKFTRMRIDGESVRVYRTGDLGRWGADGLLRFQGRADRQLKIRGHRVEPAEVERQIERLLPSVRDCRVLARRDDTGAVRELIAFCVPAKPGDPLPDAAAALRSAVVSYQRPAAVVSVDAFPVTDRGKLDERALLALVPPSEADASETEAEAERAGAEVTEPTARLVAETFGAVLDRAAVPLDVPFVELGGDSLGAGRVCARLGARLGRLVPVSRLYQNPTVAALAAWLRSTAAVDERAVEAPEPAAAAEQPLTPMQVVYLARHLFLPEDRTAHCLLTWVIEGEPDRAALESAVAAVHRRHEALRTAYRPDPRPIAELVDISPPPLEVLEARPSVDAAVAASRAELADRLEPAEGDVWRTVLVPVGSRRVTATVFACVVHHIAFDGASESVLATDLADAYTAAVRGEGHGPSMHPYPLSQAPVRRGHAERPGRDVSAAQREFLITELTGVPALRWPGGGTGRMPGAPQHIEAELGPAVVARIDALAAECRVTRFVALLALGARSLAEVTGQSDFAVGVPVAQRDGPDLERVVGCHINMLCIRLRGDCLDGGMTGVRGTGRAVARAFAAQDVPFADVVRLVDPPRTDRPPLYQTLFALQDNPPARLDLAGLRTRFLRQPYLDLPLDLHTELWPREDGGLGLVVSFRAELVPQSTAQELVKRFTDRLHTLPSGDRL